MMAHEWMADMPPHQELPGEYCSICADAQLRYLRLEIHRELFSGKAIERAKALLRKEFRV